MEMSSRCADAFDEAAGALPPPPRQFEDDVDAVVLIFLSLLIAKTPSPAAAVQYKMSQLLIIAQAFFVLAVVRSSGDVHDGSPQVGVCTERDLYYRHPLLFGSQRATHASIERLCRWLDVGHVWSTLKRRHIEMNSVLLRQVFCKPQHVHSQLHSLLRASNTDAVTAVAQLAYTRESLGITAAGKSTLSGALIIELCRPSEYVDVSACGAAGVSLTYPLVTRLMGCHRPPSSPPLASVSALLVIEKESIYHAVLQAAERRRNGWSRSFSFLCTKGYPCVAAQQWLRRVHAVWPSLELHVLVDGDPHGLCIALTAMGLLGSRARHAIEGAVTEITPLHFAGVCPSRVFDRCITNSTRNSAWVSHATLSASEGISLTRDDRRVLRRVKAAMQGALDARVAVAAASVGSSETDKTNVRRTLEKMMQEADWMERSGIKCELQLACRPFESPLHFVEENISS
ncbi:hypothetical protein ABB37_03659 [Leptomonas pyrrhocoris]|uniref:DNA topoisomerase (ATP-hydrolyzing) n=1 Tax=Leptomonas pyrrhocoris TaxID=157538 RepID=A0A0N0DW39_LEPPY|nr:hypothetical protein ABB37_03659 [Leptomonas pyrrhocoris]KPA81241.1 hypothetical protein ABB37_03659 [Leptomonas pyrrhocoris]|eukprot:XP_015659680.1 hypothetical protein ABB37_03659 [Leptomonas pyrrhocoris]